MTTYVYGKMGSGVNFIASLVMKSLEYDDYYYDSKYNEYVLKYDNNFAKMIYCHQYKTWYSSIPRHFSTETLDNRIMVTHDVGRITLDTNDANEIYYIDLEKANIKHIIKAWFIKRRLGSSVIRSEDDGMKEIFDLMNTKKYDRVKLFPAYCEWLNDTYPIVFPTSTIGLYYFMRGSWSKSGLEECIRDYWMKFSNAPVMDKSFSNNVNNSNRYKLNYYANEKKIKFNLISYKRVVEHSMPSDTILDNYIDEIKNYHQKNLELVSKYNFLFDDKYLDLLVSQIYVNG